MGHTDTKSAQKLIEALEQAARRIRELEAEGQRILFGSNDQEAYRERMEAKAQLLLELPDTIEPLLEGISRDTAREVEARVSDFSRRAGNALGLSSLFYMSALLYPDDYKEGDKNDLERYIAQLRGGMPSA